MKKLLLPFLIALCLWAAGFDEAKKEYDAGRYEQAYSAFKSLFKSDMGNAEVNLYLARSALETRRFNEAIAAYERVLMIRPGNGVARFELGRAYYAAGLYDQAEGEFVGVLSQPLPQEVRQSILQYLAGISQARQKHHVSLFASAGLMDDSNILFDSDKGLNAAVSGRAHFEQLAFTHIYNLAEKDRFWQTRANFYNQQFFELAGSEWTNESTRLFGGSNLDVAYPSIETGWLKRGRDASLFLPIGFGVLQFGGISWYRDLSFGAQYEKPLTRNQLAIFEARLTDRMFLINLPNDAKILTLKAGLREGDDKGGLWIYSGSLEREDLTAEGSADITRLDLGAKRMLALEKGWSALLDARLKYRDQSKADRSDLALELSGTLNMPIDKTSYLALGAGYGRGNSDVNVFDYERRVFTVSYNHFFGDSAIKRIKE